MRVLESLNIDYCELGFRFAKNSGFKGSCAFTTEKFINSLTNQQLEKITNFASNAPKLSHTQNYECKKCKTENKIELSGLQDFF